VPKSIYVPFTAALTIPMAVFLAVLWVFTRLGNGAGIFRVTGGEHVPKVATDPGLDADYITRLAEDASGTLWPCRDNAVCLQCPA